MWNVWNEEFKINTPKHFALKNVSFRYKIYIQYLYFIMSVKIFTIYHYIMSLIILCDSFFFQCIDAHES